jgi:serine/threonine protein kinase
MEIDVNSVLGSGAYGMVLKGILTTKNRERIQVAIKTVKPMDDISYFKALMSELKIMGFIGKHANIVNLLGAYTKSIQKRIKHYKSYIISKLMPLSVKTLI